MYKSLTKLKVKPSLQTTHDVILNAILRLLLTEWVFTLLYKLRKPLMHLHVGDNVNFS